MAPLFLRVYTSSDRNITNNLTTRRPRYLSSINQVCREIFQDTYKLYGLCFMIYAGPMAAEAHPRFSAFSAQRTFQTTFLASSLVISMTAGQEKVQI